MKQSEAVQQLVDFLFLIQKFRSDTNESLGHNPAWPRIRADLYPWVFGDKYPIVPLTKILDRHDRTGELPIQDYYNMRHIWSSLMNPGIIAVGILIDRLLPEEPMPIVELARGWEPEDAG